MKRFDFKGPWVEVKSSKSGEYVLHADLPRPSVMAFALKMEAQLQRNESRGHWADMPLADILERITTQTGDLPAYAMHVGMEQSVQRTCADIGNYAMMFSENVVKS